MEWQATFKQSLDYRTFLDQHGTATHRDRWQAVYEQIVLIPSQQALLQGFVRRMNVVCLAGAWCGDCVSQCPILQRFAEATNTITLRFLDRDQHPDVQNELTINGGHRVPAVVFLSEDFDYHKSPNKHRCFMQSAHRTFDLAHRLWYHAAHETTICQNASDARPVTLVHRENRRP